MINVGTVELGFDAANVVTARVTLPEADYPEAEDQGEFFTLLIERLDAEPTVVSAAMGRTCRPDRAAPLGQ